MSKELSTILIVDDTESNIAILLELLRDKYDILVSIDGKSALEILDEESVDLILLDVIMPGMDGFEVCQTVKATKKIKDIPIIFITSKADELSIEKAYEIGGVDYISKPFKSTELLARVKTHLELRETIKNLEYIASHDTMTGVYNRGTFFKIAQEKFVTHDNDLYMIMIDIDNFKAINDNYGHAVGDKVIKLVASTMLNILSDDSHVGRIGGEEFAIMCHKESLLTASTYVENIRTAVEELVVLSNDGERVQFTISAGYSKIAKDTESLDSFLNEADIALYEAKGAGRNRTIFKEQGK